MFAKAGEAVICYQCGQIAFILAVDARPGVAFGPQLFKFVDGNPTTTDTKIMCPHCQAGGDDLGLPRDGKFVNLLGKTLPTRVHSTDDLVRRHPCPTCKSEDYAERLHRYNYRDKNSQTTSQEKSVTCSELQYQECRKCGAWWRLGTKELIYKLP